MKVTNRVGMLWAVAIFIVLGGVLVVVALTLGGDETDMEQQPEGAPVVVRSAATVGGAAA